MAGQEAPSGPSQVKVVEIDPSELPDSGLRLGPRRGSTRRRVDEQVPLLLEGQIAAPRNEEAEATNGAGHTPAPQVGGPFDAAALGLPSDPAAIVRYLTHRYRGVGEKTAESLVERFGADLFRVLRDDPAAISEAVTPKRAEQVLEAFQGDYERRAARQAGGGSPAEGEPRQGDRGSRRGGGRRRGSRGRSES